MHARFPPPRHKTCAADCKISPAATQTANREMLCSLENINIPLCGHTCNGVVYLCTVNLHISVCVYQSCQKLFTNTASRASVFFSLTMLFCNSFHESEVKDYM